VRGKQSTNLQIKFASIFYCATASACLIASTSALATVLEYDVGGTLDVTETKFEPSPSHEPSSVSSNSTAPDNKLRELTRDIATQFSGSAGVKKANLNALTFVEVFEALIERESRFDPNVISPKGAQGLGQLMPGTAADLGVSDPFDPEANLLGSAKYFTDQLERFGNLELALAAYNAGPERVVEHKDIPPFAETKAYIAWILNKAGIGSQSVSEAAEAANSVQAINASSNSPDNSDTPLEGDVSVWEF